MILTDNNLTFILGPTNTGKTFLAIEKMLSYETGIIGLPLRLLAILRSGIPDGETNRGLINEVCNIVDNI